MVIQGVSYPSDFEAKKLMIEIGRRMDEKGYVIAGDGSLSVRVGPNAVWVTAEGADKGALKQENFIRVDLNGKQSPGSRQVRLSEDIAVHLAVYNQNPVLRGIIHAYPAGAVSFAAKGCEAAPADYTPSVRALGRVTLVKAEETAKDAALVCKNDSGVMIAGQGCVMWGESLAEAFQRIQALEYYVKVSRMMGAGCCGSTRAPLTGGRESISYEVRTAQGDGYGTAAVKDGCTGVPVGLEEMVWRDERAAAIEGLTPVIRPGESGGFQLPGMSANLTGNTPAGSSVIPKQKQTSVPVRQQPLAVSIQHQVAEQPQIQSVTIQQPRPGSSRREQMMAEVVRRSLASLR